MRSSRFPASPGYDLCLIGAKVVGAEGDCGSCAVLIGRPSDRTMQYCAENVPDEFYFDVAGEPVYCRTTASSRAAVMAQVTVGSNGNREIR